MEPRARIWMPLLALTVLAGAWVLAETMVRVPEEALPTLAEASDESVDLAVGAARDVTALSWSWEGETVSLVRDDDGAWQNADDAACPVNDAAVQGLSRAVASVRADMSVEDVTEFSQYGLDEPSLSVIAATEENIVSYEVGSMTLTGEYYVRLNGGRTVYLETGVLAPAFRVHLADILALERVPSDIAAVTGLSVYTEAGDYELVRRAEGQVWLLSGEEGGTELEADRVRTLYEPLTELELTRCAAWDASEAGSFGLDTPRGRAIVHYVDTGGKRRSFILEFGDYTEGDVYVRFAGSGMVYLVPAAVLDGLMYPDWSSMLPLTVLAAEPEEISSLRVELGGHEYRIERLHETTEVTVSGESVEVTDIIYSADGWVLDTAAVDRWLASLSSLRADGPAAAGEGLDTLLAVTVTWADEEREPASVELRGYDSAHALCLASDGRRLLVPRQDADTLAAELEKLLVLE